MTKPAAKPENETQRLKRLKELLVLDTHPEIVFDEITKLASSICEAPIALITLVDEKRQWFKANTGLENATETEIEIAFCSHAILQNGIFEIKDAQSDPRFKNNPLVTEYPKIRFYAGAPLTMPAGEKIGTLCVINTQKQTLNTFQKTMLEGLAKITSQILVNRQGTKEEIQSNAEKLAAIISSSRDAIISKSIDGFITSWNKGAEAIFGYTAEEVIGRSILCLFPKGHEEEEAYFLKKIKNNEIIEHFETQRVTKSGDLIDVSVSLSPIKSVHDEIIGIAKIARDITPEVILKKELAYQHERLLVTMHSIADAVITTNVNGEVEYLNPVAETLTGWQLEKAQGKPLNIIFNIINEMTREPTINPIEVCLAEDRVVGLASNTILISKDGTEYGIEDSAAPIKDAKGKNFGAVLVFHDVTSQRKMAIEMAYRAAHDDLTGLLNRGEFETRLTRALDSTREHNSEHALMYIDLDQFKLINDTCGHATGDRLLKEVSHIIQSHLRADDTLSRLGGDEFAILLEKCGAEPALRIAEQICASVDQYRILFENKRYSVSSSIGLVTFNHKWKSIEHLMQSADAACYAAKDSGRNRVHLYYDADYSLESHKGDSYWASRISHALEEDRFVLFSQRIMPMKANLGIKSEILLRMIDEGGKTLPPSVYLPAAEKFHLISRIDKWVVNTTFQWIKQHKDELKHIQSISINLSGQSISDQSFQTYTLQLIESLALDCRQICFEITETAAITNINAANEFIESMQKHHIRFALDDFGSGVSSFGYLKSLPVDYLKIDGQFIKNLIDDDIDQAMVKCIVEVAQVTNKLTIAEWVENEGTEVLLKKMNVDFTQGYFRHKPAPISDLLNVVPVEVEYD